MNNIALWAEAIRYRWRSIVIVTGVTVGLAVLYLAVAPRTYTATATLFFDSEAPDPLQEDAARAPNTRNGLETEADILRSAAVARQVVRDLGLIEDRDLQTQWRKSGAQMPLDQWLTQWVERSVKIANDSNTRVVSLHANATRPDRAAELANAYASAATEKLLSLTTNAAAGYLSWLEEEVAQSDAAVSAAEGRLRDFVAVTGIPNNGDLNAEAARSANIAVQSAMAQAQAAGAQSVGGVSQHAAAEAERSPAVQNIRTQLAEKQSSLSDLSAKLGPRHPEMESARAEIAMLEEALNRERSSANAAFAAARASEIASQRSSAGATAGMLSAAAASQNSRVASMSQNIGRMTSLQNELAAAQQHHADLKRRLARMQLEANVPRNNVTRLDEATAPLLPSSPRPGLLLFLAAFLGLVLGTLVAILRETLQPYARNPASLQRALGIPVIGRVSLPKQSVRQLVDARIVQ